MNYVVSLLEIIFYAFLKCLHTQCFPDPHEKVFNGAKISNVLRGHTNDRIS